MGSGIPISTTYPMEGASIQLGFMGLGSPKNDFFPKMEDIPRKMVILVQVIKKTIRFFGLLALFQKRYMIANPVIGEVIRCSET
jgi:hypothetical protein